MTAFLVQQWGGVIFYNPSTSHNSSHVDIVMEDVMVIVVRQLKLLMGFREDEVCVLITREKHVPTK